MVDRGHQLVKRGCSRLEVEVGHAVDGLAVPAAGPRVTHAGQAGPSLRGAAAQGPQQNAVSDDVLAPGGGAVVIEGIRGKLLGPVRVKRHVQQV